MLGDKGRELARDALRWRLGFSEDAEGSLSLAERFRRALDEVEAARQTKTKRQQRRRRNRELRSLGAAERHVYASRDDFSLVDA